jgi:superfamily I DNA/RNA helicase
VIPQEEWQPAADMELEPNALTAATMTARNLVVTAGPGAGKTELLAQRADFLLRTGECRYPRRILAISFKVDAAKNLKDRVRRRCPPQLASRLDSYTFHAFAKRLIDTFRLVLVGNDALDPDYSVGMQRILHRQIDFDSMAPLATSILEASPVARTALAQTYGFVFLDEFQDCTRNQYNLVYTAFHGTTTNVIAVGDVKQRIMRFAGALDGILGQFTTDFAALPLLLYLNFRAQPRLRRMQNAMIRVMEPHAALDDAELAGAGGQVDVQSYANSGDEARALADQINTWITVEGVPADEIAVLASKQVGLYTETLRAELRARGVPFREETELQDLATEPVAVLMLDFLAVVTGEQEPHAYARLTDIATSWYTEDESAERTYAELRRTIDDARRKYRMNEHGTLRALVDRFLDFLGEQVLASLAPQYQQGARLTEVIEAVHSQLYSLFESTGNVGQALREFTGRDAVKLMSIHKAKSLEFDNVVVLAVEHEMFWGDAQDERSAYFVAISRARRVLLLTVCRERPPPAEAPWNWKVGRRPHEEFLSYALSSAENVSGQGPSDESPLEQ